MITECKMPRLIDNSRCPYILVGSYTTQKTQIVSDFIKTTERTIIKKQHLRTFRRDNTIHIHVPVLHHVHGGKVLTTIIISQKYEVGDKIC